MHFILSVFKPQPAPTVTPVAADPFLAIRACKDSLAAQIARAELVLPSCDEKSRSIVASLKDCFLKKFALYEAILKCGDWSKYLRVQALIVEYEQKLDNIYFNKSEGSSASYVLLVELQAQDQKLPAYICELEIKQQVLALELLETGILDVLNAQSKLLNACRINKPLEIIMSALIWKLRGYQQCKDMVENSAAYMELCLELCAIVLEIVSFSQQVLINDNIIESAQWKMIPETKQQEFLRSNAKNKAMLFVAKMKAFYAQILLNDSNGYERISYNWLGEIHKILIDVEDFVNNKYVEPLIQTEFILPEPLITKITNITTKLKHSILEEQAVLADMLSESILATVAQASPRAAPVP